MMRLLLSIGLLLFASDAYAEDGVWGFMVFDHEGTFVTAKWPEQKSFVAGSSQDAYLQLEGLAPLHAYFELQDGDFLVRPMFEADVLVNNVRIEGDTVFTTRDTLALGRYKINFVLATDPPPEELPPAADPGDGSQIDPMLAADRADQARKPEFEKPGYAFCHDEHFGESGTAGTDFCVIFDETTTQVCPKARETCPRWKPHEGTLGGGAGGNGKGKGKGKGVGDGAGSGGNVRRVEKRRVVIPIPKEVGLVLLVLVGGGLLFWFVKSMMSAGWESEDVDLEIGELSDAAKNLQALPEARSNVLVKLAERALNRGDPKEAAILLHLAVLRYLDDEGLARYHSSKTNGDYLRAIRKLKELRDLFRGIATETERVRFGDGQVDATAVGRLIEDGKTLLKRAAPDSIESASPGAAILIVLALLAPGLQACPSEEDEEDLTPAFYSHGPTGLFAMPVILRDAGLDVSIGHERFADVDSSVGVVVFRTSAASKSGWPKGMRLDDLLDRNIAVVVIDDRARSPFFLPTGEIMDWGPPAAVQLEVNRPGAESFCSWRVAALRDRFRGPTAPVLPRGRRIVWDGLSTTATVSSHELRLHPLIMYEGEPETMGQSAAVAYATDRINEEATLSGCMYVFSDRDLFTNASLTRTTNARFVASFFTAITPPGQKIAILDRVDDWATAGSGGGGAGNDDANQPSPGRTMRASNMLPFVLQSLATVVLLYLLLGAAFAPLRDPFKREHKAFVEHVEAIGRQYARTGQAGLTHVAQSLAKLVVMRHRDRVRGGPSGGWLALARHLAETHSLPEDDVKAALRLGIEGVTELGTPRIEDPQPSSEQMLKTLSRLLNVRTKEVTEKPKRRFRIGRKR